MGIISQKSEFVNPFHRRISPFRRAYPALDKCILYAKKAPPDHHQTRPDPLIWSRFARA